MESHQPALQDVTRMQHRPRTKEPIGLRLRSDEDPKILPANVPTDWFPFPKAGIMTWKS